MTLPLTLESVAPTARDAAITSLSKLLGDRLSTAVSVREQHGHDASYHRCAPPDAVAFAESTEEVSEIVKVCASHKVPIIPFGSGSGLEGHVVALRGGMPIDLSRMNQILRVSPGDLNATVQAGVTHKQLNKYLRDKDPLFFRRSRSRCYLGRNGGDARFGHYGSAIRNDAGIRPVAHGCTAGWARDSHGAPSAEVFGRLRSDPTLRRLGGYAQGVHRGDGPPPELPAAISAAMCSFPSVEDAVNTVMQTIQAGVPVARMELADAIRMEAIIRIQSSTCRSHRCFGWSSTGRRTALRSRLR
jgi:D-lactate dehydrogenase (cytochrome)